MFVSLLLLTSFSFSNHFVSTALAAEKTDTVTGTITLSIESDVPVGPADPSNPGDDPIVDPSAPSSDDVAQAPDAIQNLLAKTGDALPYVALLLVFAGVAVAGVMVVSRKKATQAGSTSDSVSNFSNVQKIAAVLLAALLVSGSAIAFNKAIADDNLTETNIASAKPVATIDGKIVVSEDGTIKSKNLAVTDNLKKDLAVNSFVAKVGSDIADLINGRISIAKASLAPSETVQASWNINGKISQNLLNKIYGSYGLELNLGDDLEVDVAFEGNTVEFWLNDGTQNCFDKPQQVPDGEAAFLPSEKPRRNGYLFIEWNTAEDGTGSAVDQFYLNNNIPTADVLYYAKWKEVPDVFLAQKLDNTADNNVLPCNIYGANDPTEYKSIEEVKAVALSLANGGANPDEEVYNAINDEWHLFAKISGDGSNPNDWIECRIIHVGKHDDDGSGLTFQTVHALPDLMSYDSSYDQGENPIQPLPYKGSWETSEVRQNLNVDFFNSLPNGLRSSIKQLSKKTNNNGDDAVGGIDPVASVTDDKVWLIGITELVSDMSSKRSGWTDNHDGSTYSFWADKDLSLNGSTPEGSLQRKLFKSLIFDRTGSEIYFSDPMQGYSDFSYLRSIDWTSYRFAMALDTTGSVQDWAASVRPQSDVSVSPCFAL